MQGCCRGCSGLGIGKAGYAGAGKGETGTGQLQEMAAGGGQGHRQDSEEATSAALAGGRAASCFL